MNLKKLNYLVPLIMAITILSVSVLIESYINESVIKTIRVFSITLLLLSSYFRKSLTFTILMSMLIGIIIGHEFPDFSQKLKIISQIFLRLIKTIIAPLLFGTLVTGIAGHGNIKQVGRLGWKSILYFEIVTTLALIIGLLVINFTQAGVGIELPALANEDIPQVAKQSFSDIILHIFPENIAKAIFEGAILQIVLFSILFGVGLSLTEGKHKTVMLDFVESLSEVMFKFTKIVMYAAPIAVGAAIAYTVGHMGLGILSNLLKLLLSLYLALAIFLIFVLFPIALFYKVKIKKLAKLIAEPVAIAFATTSSEAALPKAMKALEEYGVSRKVVAFTMPMGYSFNLDGTTLYLSLATIFVAQAAGIDLSTSVQISIMLTLMLTSKGVAGVPRASLVILMGTLASFNLPVEPVFIILGIDELMDMARTSVNVIGNCLATVVIAKSEGELFDEN
jgi:proton glutamate symport protein